MARSTTLTNTPYRRRRLGLAAMLGVAAIGVGALAGCAPAADSGTASEGGGVFRVGLVGTGSSETLDPGKMDSDASIARAYQIFEPLVERGSDEEPVKYVLAESLTANDDASVWTLKLRDGVTWHDGSPLTVDDVIYTVNYHVDNQTWASNVWSNIDRENLKKVDDLTLEIPLTSPNFLYPEMLIEGNELIIKDGTTDFEEPVGTGPFMFESFTPGQRSTFARYDDYWGDVPKVAEVEINSINDETARVNALTSGQVDAIASVPFSGIAQLEGAGVEVSNEESGGWVGIRMNTKVAPFDDPRVRQAMRLLIDREQIVDNAYGGNAKIGNDLFGWWDSHYAELPQRTYDPERARELLKEAGYENLTLTLPGIDVGPGSVQMATLFAASAAEAGVTINVEQMPLAEFYATPYTEVAWNPTAWGASPLSAHMFALMSRESIEAGRSETSWEDPEFLDAFEAAITASDPEVQNEQLIAAQTRVYEEGGYIIPAFFNLVTAHSKDVSGLKSNINLPFGDFDFTSVAVAE